MAGGGQMRPMGGAMQTPLRGTSTAVAPMRDPSVLDSGVMPLPGPPMSGGKGGNGEIPRAMPAPAPSTQYSPMAAPAQAQPQGFDVNQAAAGGLQQAFQGTEDAMQGPNIGQFMNASFKC